MDQDDITSLALARELHAILAGSNLLPEFARLYSQYTRLRADQPGLSIWQDTEFYSRLDEAIRLIDAALTERAAQEGDWSAAMRRAAELLEWLSHPKINTAQLPIRLLAAVTYQIAGYPARALGLLNEYVGESSESQILVALLKAQFPELLKLLTQYWATNLANQQKDTSDEIGNSEIHNQIVHETVKALGILSYPEAGGYPPGLCASADQGPVAPTGF